MSSNVFLGRQPILDRDGSNIGFSLNYSDTAGQGPGGATPEHLVEAAMIEWGFNQLLGGRLGYVRSGAGLLAAGLLDIVPVHRSVIELDHDVPLDDNTATLIDTHRSNGQRFAIDGLRAADKPGVELVAEHIDVVRVDIRDMTADSVMRAANVCRATFPNALLLASGVDNQSMRDAAGDADFDLFEGYFFAKLDDRAVRPRATGSTGAVMLLAEVTSQDVDIDRIETLVSSDPGLAYAIMRLVNSSAFGLNVRIHSVHHAIVMVGFAQIRQLAVLLTMSQNSRARSREVIVLASLRAHLAGELSDKAHRSAAFTAGLLSVIDTVFGAPMKELLADIPLPDDVINALVSRTGPIGEVLAVIDAFEEGDVERLEALRPGEGDALRKSYAKSVVWSENIRDTLFSATA